MLELLCYTNALLAGGSIAVALVQAALRRQDVDAARANELLLRFIWLSAALAAISR